MHKILGPLAATALAGAGLLSGVQAPLAHAALLPPGGNSVANHHWGEIGCHVDEANTNRAPEFTHADGFVVETSNTYDAPVAFTDTHATTADTSLTVDPTTHRPIYDRQVTEHKVISASDAMHDVTLSIPFDSSRYEIPSDVTGMVHKEVAVLSVTNATPTRPGQVVLTQAQLDELGNSAEMPASGQRGVLTGLSIPKGGFIAVDTTVVLQRGLQVADIASSGSADDYAGLASQEVDGFLDPSSGDCAIVTTHPAQTHVDGQGVDGNGNDEIGPAPAHTTVASDTGWVKGVRTVTYRANIDDDGSTMWLFHDPDNGARGYVDPAQAKAGDGLRNTMQVVYTESPDPVTTTRTVPVQVQRTTYVDRKVTTSVPVTTGLDSTVLVQADTYHTSFRKGTWDGRHQRTRDIPFTAAQLRTLAGLDDDNLLKPSEDRGLWGSTESRVIALKGTDIARYGSPEKAAQHQLGWSHVDDDVTSVKPGASVHKLWVLGAGATAKDPFGARHTVAQVDIDHAVSPVRTTTRQVTRTVKVPVTTTVTENRQVTTTTTAPAVAPKVSYPEPSFN